MLPLLLVACVGLCSFANAYASYQFCTGWGSWERGALYNQMNADLYSTDAEACTMSISPPTETYLPGQEYTLTVQPNIPMGIKVVLLGGAEFTYADSKGDLGSSTCANYELAVPSATLKFTAPKLGGKLTIKALCGRLDYVHVVDDIVLLPGEGVAPLPLELSQDPDYTYQQTLSSKVVLHYAKNESHLKVNLEYAGLGYVSFGVGRKMMSSLALIGMDPVANAGMKYPALGLYKLEKRKRTGQVQLLQGGNLFDSTGIDSASFTQLGNGKSVLAFTQLLSKQTPGFTFASDKSDAPVTDVIWAVGKEQRLSKHAACGMVLDVEFVSNGGDKDDQGHGDDGNDHSDDGNDHDDDSGDYNDKNGDGEEEDEDDNNNNDDGEDDFSDHGVMKWVVFAGLCVLGRGLWMATGRNQSNTTATAAAEAKHQLTDSLESGLLASSDARGPE